MATQTATAELTTHHRPFFKSLYFQVLTAIVLGVLLGHFYPELGEQMKPLGDAFIKTIKMIIAHKNIVDKFPDLYFIASGGVSGMDDVRRLGEIGCKGVIIGKAIYEGRISLKELTKTGGLS